jgi:hypothetical protein
MEDQYQGHQGLHSLWIDLENIIRVLEKRRQNGNGATKEIIKDLRDLNSNLFSLHQQWYRESTREPEARPGDLLKRLIDG